MSKQYAMVIDLKKCVGCGACALACKTENNTQVRSDGQSFNWADFHHETTGTFPSLSHTTRPVLCNHCTAAACVEACPVTPKAMFKTEDGVTMHNDERCIGCRMCQMNCPYSQQTVGEGEWSVISFNGRDSEPHARYRDKVEVLAGMSASGAEIAEAVGAVPPHANLYSHPEYDAVRRAGIVEKCIFCDHRTKNGENPYCVDSCPSGARVFGDINDPGSDAAMLLKQYDAKVLKPEAGTSPNVYYIRSF